MEIGRELPCLDMGYVKFIDTWGSDQTIVEAARMSTDKGFLGWGSSESPGDEKLLKYLYKNKHSTPFEQAGLVIEVKAPIFVFREWHRHRTQSYNEMSARYTPLPDENYLPSTERVMLSSLTNKQAGTIKGAAQITEQGAVAWRKDISKFYQEAEVMYQAGLDCGVPKEIARLCVPVARYSRMRACANLRNWLGFLTLRMDKAAQWEIRQYANAVAMIIEEIFPRTWSIFIEQAAVHDAS